MIFGRLRAAIADWACTALTVVVDATPPHLRYGAVRRFLNFALAPAVPSLPELRGGTPDQALTRPIPDAMSSPTTLPSVLATGRLGIGGVESVVATLARQLPSKGVQATVMCAEGGPTAESLRRDGITVLEARNDAEAGAVLDALAPEVVELHNAPEHMATAAIQRGIPIVPVVHNQEIHRSAAEWRAVLVTMSHAHVTVAVSEAVRQHHLRHLTGVPSADVQVVPNGVQAPGRPAPAEARCRARDLLSTTVGADLSEACVVVCLARYDAQKNLPGLVLAFLDAAARRRRLHLVVAGAVSDRLELCRAQVQRWRHPRADHVHLLGASTADTLLLAADALVLDSFFEGGPLVAAEALMAGLPIVLADAGAARDFVGNNERGILVPNPAGPASAVDERLVRIARRHLRHQRNRTALADALVRIHDDTALWARRREELAAQAARLFGLDAMVSGHAAALMLAAGKEG